MCDAYVLVLLVMKRLRIISHRCRMMKGLADCDIIDFLVIIRCTCFSWLVACFGVSGYATVLEVRGIVFDMRACMHVCVWGRSPYTATVGGGVGNSASQR